MPSQVLVNGIIAGSAYALVAASFSLVYSTARFFHLAHAAVLTWAAYLLIPFSDIFGSPFLSVPASVIGGGILGVTLYLAVYRPLQARGAGSLMLLVASLGLLMALQSLVSVCFGDAIRSVSGFRSATHHVFNVSITTSQVLLVLTAGVLAFALWIVLRHTSLGLRIRAVADNRDLSVVVGLEYEKILAIVFLIASSIVAVAGVFIAVDTDLTPMMGFRALLFGIVAAILGGVGSLTGSFLGGYLVGVVQNLTSWVFPGQWQDTGLYVVLIVFLLFRPRGLIPGPE